MVKTSGKDQPLEFQTKKKTERKRDRIHPGSEDFSIEPEMFRISRWFQPITPRKINIEPENEGLEDDFPNFQGCILRFHVNFPGCIIFGGVPFAKTFGGV